MTDHKTESAVTDAEWRQRLTPEQFNVTRKGGTEGPFTGKYWDSKTDGTYNCVCCGTPLFESSTKFESGSGWPSFFQPINEDAVRTIEDRKFGMIRIEVVCATCDAHLGHIFPDGPQPTGMRYCMNSASLDLQEASLDVEENG